MAAVTLRHTRDHSGEDTYRQIMDALSALVVIAGLVALATVLGLVVRARSARVAAGCGGDEHRLSVEGADVTLVQLSSPVCAACTAMRRIATEVTANNPTVAHREIDVADEPEVARRHSVYSTPTTLVLDREGHVHSRLIGAVKPADVRAAVDAARTQLVTA